MCYTIYTKYPGIVKEAFEAEKKAKAAILVDTSKAAQDDDDF